MKLLTLLLFTICSTASAQLKPAKNPRILKYYHFGIAPSAFVDTESLYGFKMKWKGCLIKDRHIRHNKRIERKINERLGENWLALNFESLYNKED